MRSSRTGAPRAKRARTSTEIIDELKTLVEQGEEAQNAKVVAQREAEIAKEQFDSERKRFKEDADSATEQLDSERNRFKEEANKAEEKLNASLDHRLSALPHYNRYTRTETKPLAKDDPLYSKLETSFLSSLTSHRGPNRGDPHRQVPKLTVTRIERIHVPRLQEKYLVELQDIAGLCEQKATKMNGVNAPRVQSIEGLDLNEFLMYHGAPADLIDRLEKQGLDPRYAGEHFGKLFGAGVYLATNASKSDIYTTQNAAGERCIMLVRTCLGEPQYTKEGMPGARKPAERPDGRGAYNSIVAKTKTPTVDRC